MSNNALDAVKSGISDQNLIYCSLKSQEQDCGSEFIFLEKLVTILSAGEFWDHFCFTDINIAYGVFINGFNSKTGISSTKFISWRVIRLDAVKSGSSDQDLIYCNLKSQKRYRDCQDQFSGKACNYTESKRVLRSFLFNGYQHRLWSFY